MVADYRVKLRDIRTAELEKVLHWRNDPEVGEYLAEESISWREVQEWYDQATANPCIRLYAIEAKDGRFIGYGGLQDIDWAERTASLYIIIGEKDYWDRGYGRTTVLRLAELAFEELELNRLDLAVLPFNYRGIACYERCGFRRVGFLNDWYLRRGKPWRSIHMRMTREQYFVAKKTWSQN
ncbi:MAG: N-acetyltransferase [Chloroflexota bacterium]|nr:MAG: N-acetyltransferase [Chloroflexota bacterium]